MVLQGSLQFVYRFRGLHASKNLFPIFEELVAGFTPIKGKVVDVPLIAECPVF